MVTGSARHLSLTLLQLPSAYLLVSHGSRDPRPQAALDQLAELLKLRLEDINKLYQPYSYATSQALVGTVTLELAALPLHEQIRQFGDRVKATGLKQLLVLPLFLLPGVHVMEDIPAEVTLAQQVLSTDLTINLQPHLGAHPKVGRLLAHQIAAVGTLARILLSHGSRRIGGNQPIEEIAAELGALPAYWSVPASLEERVAELVNSGHQQIAILPYFLFSGRITEAIAQAVQDLQDRFPAVQLSLGEPIGASAELADLIVDLSHFNPFCRWN
ncbi:MAG: CbiX/SirB N-terminal domain-containing protein [Chamaesiphon sp.]